MNSSGSEGAQFPTPEIKSLWLYLDRTIDRFTAIANDLPGDSLHWAPPVAESNSVAVLLVHTLGNIEENILEILGGEPVHRQRETEFVASDLTGARISERWQELRARLEQRLTTLPAGELERERFHSRRGTITGRDVLLAAITHANEHLGQAELTRDLWRFAHAAPSDT